MVGFTEKNKRFAEEFVIDLNGKQAAIRAGYSESTAKEQAHRMLTNVHVQDYIAELKAKASEKLEISHEQLLLRLKNWMEADITETINLKPSQVKKLPLEIKQLITKYKQIKKVTDYGTEETIELHFVSKEKAIELIAKHIGFFEVDNKQKSTIVNISGMEII